MAKKKKAGYRQGNGKLSTPLAGHSRVGKALIPPMMTLPGVSFQSWANQRLPEMLWACLTVTVLPRAAALSAFREIAAVGMKYRDESGVAKAKGWSLNQSALPSQPVEIIECIVKTVIRHPLGYAALRPLLLLESLPGKDIWRAMLAATPADDDWRTLGDSVLKTFDHQSQEATDVRWLSLLFKIGLGELRFPESLREEWHELVEYPNRGEMASVRPFIRSTEMSFSMGLDGDEKQSEWPEAFWKECLDRTQCLPMPPMPPAKVDRSQHDFDAFATQLKDVRDALIDHWACTLATSGVDAKHDAVFGFGLFALSCLLEILAVPNGFGITGRVLLRTLAECRISFAYLVHCGDDAMWEKFRKYGSGQAKLALLKFEETAGEKPRFVMKATLEALANEDFYQEYVQMDLGHWCGKDLRKLAEDSGTKGDYDRFYGWPSGFVHGQWGALRDTNLTNCMNPLHRFHRVPLPSHRLMEDSAPDAMGLVNSMLDDINFAYPGFASRLTMAARAEEISESSEVPSEKQ
jgi:hypothetical protein